MVQVSLLQSHKGYRYYSEKLSELIISQNLPFEKELRRIYYRIKLEKSFKLLVENKVEKAISGYLLSMVRSFIQCSDIPKNLDGSFSMMLIVLEILVLDQFDRLTQNRGIVEISFSKIVSSKDIFQLIKNNGPNLHIFDKKIDQLEKIIFS